MKKLLLILLTLPSLLLGQSDLINRVKLQIAEERIRVIKSDGSLSDLNERIIREHKKLAKELSEHPQVKDSKLAAKELTALKMKLLEEDEDLNDLRLRLVKLHRNMEDKLLENKLLKRLYSQLDVLSKRK